MSVLSNMEDTIKEHFSAGQGTLPMSGGFTVDAGQVLEVVNMIVQAAPAIEEGLVSAAPFVEALIAAISNGGLPTGDQWDALRARLDGNSTVLADAEARIQAELTPVLPVDPGVSAPKVGE